MRVTRYGHSCLLVESGDARLLLDPGVFSSGFEGLEGLTGVLLTHQHPDHLDLARLPPLLERNPGAVVHCDAGSSPLLGDVPHTVVGDGDRFDLGAPVQAVGSEHAVIHPDLPGVSNVGYLVDDRFFTPGDALTVPEADVEVLGLPTAAPWLKLSDAVDLLRAISPARALPVHDALLTAPALGIWFGQFERLAPPGTDFRPLGPAESW